MIRFPCSKCGKALGIADTEAGKFIKCPACGEKVKIPGDKAAGGAAPRPPGAVQKAAPRKPPAETDGEDEGLVEVEPVEEAEEPRRPPRVKVRAVKRQDEEDEEEDEEPRRRRRRRRDDDEDYDDEEKGFITPDRIRGVGGILAGGGCVAAGLLIEKFQQEDLAIMKYTCLGLAGLLVVAGIFYLIKG